MSDDVNKTTGNPEKSGEQFPSNSYRNIKPAKKEESPPAVKSKGQNDGKKGRVTEKKKTIGERIAENFISTDKEEIREHVVFDVIIPVIKTVIEDIVHMFLYGGGSDSRIIRERGESRPRYVYYSQKSDDRRRRDDEPISHRGNRRPELIFNRRSDAEQVLSGMCEFIDDYGKATRKDFYNVVFEVSDGELNFPTDYTMTRYGWRDLSTASVVQVREGYLLKMPRAEVL